MTTSIFISVIIIIVDFEVQFSLSTNAFITVDFEV